MNKIYIISYPDEFRVGEFSADTMLEQHLNVNNARVVCECSSLAEALEGIERAQSLEKILRPAWQAAIEHEIRLRNMMLDAVCTAAKPIVDLTGQEKGN